MKRLLLALALIVLLGASFVSACGPSKAEVAAQQKDDCFANESQLKLAINLVHADTGVYPEMKDVLAQVHVACPAGGVYSFDPTTDVVSCTVHGHP